MVGSLFLYPTADYKSLVVWDTERQQVLGQLEGHDDEIRVATGRGSMAVSYQQHSPMTGRVWNLLTMQCTATLPAHEDQISSACCIEGKVLLGQEDGIIKLWDVAASTPVALADLEGHTAEVNDVKAATAESMVLSGSADKTLRLWDLRANSNCVRLMEGHSDSVWSVDMDGQCHTAVSGSKDEKVKVWDLGSGRCIETYRAPDATAVYDVLMHESGSSFLSLGYQNNIVNTWSVGSTRAIMRADMVSSCVHGSVASRIFASEDLSTVAFCSISGSQLGLCVWRWR